MRPLNCLRYQHDRIALQLLAGIERNVTGLAVRAVDDQTAPVAQLVGQPLGGQRTGARGEGRGMRRRLAYVRSDQAIEAR
ncbi:hypothetical protein GCM10025795_34900 [Verticiella sediminum]